jgi:hypothetical protein
MVMIEPNKTNIMEFKIAENNDPLRLIVKNLHILKRSC